MAPIPLRSRRSPDPKRARHSRLTPEVLCPDPVTAAFREKERGGGRKKLDKGTRALPSPPQRPWKEPANSGG